MYGEVWDILKDIWFLIFPLFSQYKAILFFKHVFFSNQTNNVTEKTLSDKQTNEAS